MQTWFNLSDEGTEDAIYDSYAMRSFLGINFMTEQVPDATTLLKFRNRRMPYRINTCPKSITAFVSVLLA